MSHAIREWEDDFLGLEVNPQMWTKATTQTAGTPLVQSVSPGVEAGEVELLMDATNEIQSCKLTQNDVLWLPEGALRDVEFWVKTSAQFNAAHSLFFGLMSGFNATPGSITSRCLFRKSGANTIKIETSDGTNSVTTNNDTLLDFVPGVYKRFTINFASLGRSNVEFGMDGVYGQHQRMLPTTVFNVSLSTTGYQLGFYLSKTAVAAGVTVTVDRVKVRYAKLAI